MTLSMKRAFRMFRRGSRGGTFYMVNNATGEISSLKTSDQQTAQKLLDVENEARKSASYP